MASSEIVRARIDANLKKEVSAVLKEMGLSVSDAIRLTLMRIAEERAMPFEIRIPNAETREAFAAIERGEVGRFSSVEALLADLSSDEDNEIPVKRGPL